MLCSGRWYARRGIKRDGKITAIYMHRAVLGLSHADHEIVDHINGNGLDTRRENIRITTFSQNSLNITTKRAGAGLRGVYLQAGKFVVRVAKQYAGVFDSISQAAFAANKILERLSPGIGERNTVDFDALIQELEMKRREIDEQLAEVRGARVV